MVEAIEKTMNCRVTMFHDYGSLAWIERVA